MSTTSVAESRVIPASVTKVWSKIRPLDFKFWPLVKSCELETGASLSEVGSVRKVTFKDGTVQRIQLVMLSEHDYKLAYEVISSEPAISIMSSYQKIKLCPITHDNTTLISWSGYFSSDCDANVIEDSKFKKKEAFENLVKLFK